MIHLVGLLNSRGVMRRQRCGEEADVSGSPPLFLSAIKRVSCLCYSADVAEDACQKKRCVGRERAARALTGGGAQVKAGRHPQMGVCECARPAGTEDQSWTGSFDAAFSPETRLVGGVVALELFDDLELP